MKYLNYQLDNNLVEDIKEYLNYKKMITSYWIIIIICICCLTSSFVTLLLNGDSNYGSAMSSSLLILGTYLRTKGQEGKRKFVSKLDKFIPDIAPRTSIDHYDIKVIPKNLTFYKNTEYRNLIPEVIKGDYILLKHKNELENFFVLRQYHSGNEGSPSVDTLEQLDIIDDYNEILQDLEKYKNHVDVCREVRLVLENKSEKGNNMFEVEYDEKNTLSSDVKYILKHNEVIYRLRNLSFIGYIIISSIMIKLLENKVIGVPFMFALWNKQDEWVKSYESYRQKRIEQEKQVNIINFVENITKDEHKVTGVSLIPNNLKVYLNTDYRNLMEYTIKGNYIVIHRSDDADLLFREYVYDKKVHLECLDTEDEKNTFSKDLNCVKDHKLLELIYNKNNFNDD